MKAAFAERTDYRRYFGNKLVFAIDKINGDIKIINVEVTDTFDKPKSKTAKLRFRTTEDVESFIDKVVFHLKQELKFDRFYNIQNKRYFEVIDLIKTDYDRYAYKF